MLLLAYSYLWWWLCVLTLLVWWSQTLIHWIQVSPLWLPLSRLPRMSSAHPTSSHIVTPTPSSEPIDPQKFMLQQLKCCQEMWTAFWARYAFSKHSLDSNLKETPISQSHLNYRLRPMCSHQEGRISPEKLLFCLIWDEIILLDCSSPLWNTVVLNMQGLFENILGKGGSVDCSADPAGLPLRLCGQFLQFAATPKIAWGFRSLVLEIWERSAGVELQKHLTSCLGFPQVTWPLDKSVLYLLLLLLCIDRTYTHSPNCKYSQLDHDHYIQLWTLYCFFFPHYCDQVHNRKQGKEGRVNLALSSPGTTHLGS